MPLTHPDTADLLRITPTSSASSPLEDGLVERTITFEIPSEASSLSFFRLSDWSAGWTLIRAGGRNNLLPALMNATDWPVPTGEVDLRVYGLASRMETRVQVVFHGPAGAEAGAVEFLAITEEQAAAKEKEIERQRESDALDAVDALRDARTGPKALAALATLRRWMK